MAEELLDKKQLKILFAKLLGSKEAWVPFTEYIWKLPSIAVGDEMDHKNDLNILFEWDPDDWLNAAFDWENSPEGFGFWDILNDRWIDILEMNNDEYYEKY